MTLHERPRWLPATAAVATALTVVCALTIDRPVARWLAGRDTWPALWNRGISLLEYPLGIEPWKWTGVAVLVAGVIASRLVPRWRVHAPAWLLVASSHLLARNLTLWIKTFTGRLRPSEWLARGGDTFLRDGGISFPSGHVMLFATIALPLALVYPRARPLVGVVAFAMVARVAVNAHFLSDVIGGLALAAAVTWACAALVRRTVPPPPSPR